MTHPLDILATSIGWAITTGRRIHTRRHHRRLTPWTCPTCGAHRAHGSGTGATPHTNIGNPYCPTPHQDCPWCLA